MNDQKLLANHIAKVALDHYENVLPSNKGKPKDNEWTVYAAIVASVTTPQPPPPPTPTTNEKKCQNNNNNNTNNVNTDEGTIPSQSCCYCWVVSCATGTKCTAISNNNMLSSINTTSSSSITSNNNKNNNNVNDDDDSLSLMILADSHAEVLAKRGLVRVLWNEINHYYSTDNSSNINLNNNNNETFRMRKDGNDNNNNHSLLEVVVVNPLTQGYDDDDKNSIIIHQNSSADDVSDDASTKKESNTGLNHCGLNTMNDNNTCKFRLRQGLRLHLYISDSPCGDASLYTISKSSRCNNTDSIKKNNISSSEEQEHHELQFTGAKVIVSNQTNVTSEECGGKNQLLPTPCNDIISLAETNLNNKNNRSINSIQAAETTNNCNSGTLMVQPQLSRETVQILGKLRTKSGRSNLEIHRRSTSMSCSDKIVRWCILGFQGSLLSTYIPDPIPIASIVVSLDPRSSVVPVKQQQQEEEDAVVEQKELSSIVDCTNTNITNNTDHTSQLHALQRAVSDRVIAVKNDLSNSIENNDMYNNIHNNNNNNIRQQISNRVNHICVPDVYISNHQFLFGKSAIEYKKQTMLNNDSISRKRHRSDAAEESGEGNRNEKVQLSIQQMMMIPKKYSPAGLSINWQQCEIDHSIELTVGARGIKHGKKPKCIEDYKSLTSRLSNRSIINTITIPNFQNNIDVKDTNFLASCHKLEETTSTTLFSESAQKKCVPTKNITSMSEYKVFKTKYSPIDYHLLKHRIFHKGPLAGWIVSGGTNSVNSFTNSNVSSSGCCEERK